jgi:hypothetical protein
MAARTATRLAALPERFSELIWTLLVGLGGLEPPTSPLSGGWECSGMFIIVCFMFTEW